MIIERNTINFLNSQLNLPALGDEQDWEVEMSNPDRIGEFVRFYQNNSLSEDQQVALMALILSSLEDSFYKKAEMEEWEVIKTILQSKTELFKELLQYWALKNEVDHNGWFKITPLVREIYNK